MASILLIEDETTIRENTIEMLELEGFDAMGAENGKVGLEMIRSRHPDMIICDIQMPVMNGYELIRQVKRDPETREIPFIFFTAKAELESEAEGLGLGALMYLKKPIRSEQLLDVISGLGLK